MHKRTVNVTATDEQVHVQRARFNGPLRDLSLDILKIAFAEGRFRLAANFEVYWLRNDRGNATRGYASFGGQ